MLALINNQWAREVNGRLKYILRATHVTRTGLNAS